MPVALQVANLRCRSLDVDFNDISWEVTDTTEDVLDYTFQVLRSEAVEGPYDSISTEFEDRYSFLDNALVRGHLYRQFHYKLRVRHKASGAVTEVGPVSKEADPDLITTEVRKHINLLMREFAGRRCWVFPIRTFGSRCPCRNAVLQKQRRSNCVSCFDTGYLRGYMRPIESWIQIDPNPDAEQNSAVGPNHQQSTTARLGYYPPLKPRDMIIEGENNRWRVVQVNTTQHLRASLHQEVSMHLIPHTDTEYTLDFELTEPLNNLWLSPSRNFTNPQTLESFQNEEIPDIFGIYPVARSSEK